MDFCHGKRPQGFPPFGSRDTQGTHVWYHAWASSLPHPTEVRPHFLNCVPIKWNREIEAHFSAERRQVAMARENYEWDAKCDTKYKADCPGVLGNNSTR